MQRGNERGTPLAKADGVTRQPSPRRLSPLPACALAALLAAPTASAADAPVNQGHRVSEALGLAFTLEGGDIDGHRPQTNVGPNFRLGYAYRVCNGLELGATATLTVSTEQGDAPSIFLPALGIRAFLELDREDRFELGLSGRIGPLVMWLPNVHDDSGPSSHTHVWVGHGFALAPDFQVHLRDNTSFFFSPELAGGPAHDSSGIRGYYLSEDSGFAQLAAWIGLVERF